MGFLRGRSEVSRAVAGVVLVVTTALGAGITLLPWGGSTTGELVRISVVDERRETTISYQGADGSTQYFRVPDEQVPDGIDEPGDTVWVGRDAQRNPTVVDPPTDPGWITAAGGGVGLLLGLVTVATLSGFGFIPGTGRSGQTDAHRVREDHGFYWRS